MKQTKRTPLTFKRYEDLSPVERISENVIAKQLGLTFDRTQHIDFKEQKRRRNEAINRARGN